jgi:general secretion pathway protein D
VFLRPVVLRDARATQSLSADRYELMRTLQQGAQPAPSAVLPINDAPTLPALAPQPAVPAEPANSQPR